MNAPDPTAAPDAETLAALLETLVNMPSETGSEDAIASWVEARLCESGGVKNGGECLRSGNAVVWRGPRRAGHPLLVLAGHLDTVPENGNGTARRDGDRLYGLGTSDMKSGDVMMLALHAALDPATLRFDLAMVFYDAEEGPLADNGLRRLLAEMPWLRQASLAILLEPTDLRLEAGCNGSMNAEVTVRGRSAHSSRPWLGVNAIERAAPWLVEITRFPATPTVIQGAEFRETLQVTRLGSGRAKNVIPDELTLNLNYRFPPDRSIDDAEARLRALVPAEFEFRVADAAPPGRVVTDHEEVRRFIAMTGAPIAGKQGWTDVAQFSAAGVPAFNFGPGIPELSHQVDEYCPIPNLGVAYRWLEQFIRA